MLTGDPFLDFQRGGAGPSRRRAPPAGFFCHTRHDTLSVQQIRAGQNSLPEVCFCKRSDLMLRAKLELISGSTAPSFCYRLLGKPSYPMLVLPLNTAPDDGPGY
jgi:hypothetical protein